MNNLHLSEEAQNDLADVLMFIPRFHRPGLLCWLDIISVFWREELPEVPERNLSP